jgi:hypothetical protein
MQLLQVHHSPTLLSPFTVKKEMDSDTVFFKSIAYGAQCFSFEFPSFQFFSELTGCCGQITGRTFGLYSALSAAIFYAKGNECPLTPL